jgi:hypothetical protein
LPRRSWLSSEGGRILAAKPVRVFGFLCVFFAFYAVKNLIREVHAIRGEKIPVPCSRSSR